MDKQREKLIELIKHIVIPYFAEQIADHLLANGVIVPPIKMGQELYGINGCVERVVQISLYEHGLKMFGTIEESQKGIKLVKRYFASELGKTIFLSKEDAEKALKVLKAVE